MGLKQNVPRKVYVNAASKEEKDEFKKRPTRYLWISNTTKRKKEFETVSTDESFFFYDSLVRCAWIDEEKRPVIRVTGSHKQFYLFVL